MDGKRYSLPRGKVRVIGVDGCRGGEQMKVGEEQVEEGGGKVGG